MLTAGEAFFPPDVADVHDLERTGLERPAGESSEWSGVHGAVRAIAHRLVGCSRRLPERGHLSGGGDALAPVLHDLSSGSALPSTRPCIPAP